MGQIWSSFQRFWKTLNEPPLTVDSVWIRGIIGGLSAFLGVLVANAVTPSFTLQLAIVVFFTFIYSVTLSYLTNYIIHN